nr:unnamed protein product [Spirometra erinaceieuropaei]
MLIEYRRPSGLSSSGFVANYRIVCGTYIKADSGVINSSFYESNYLPDKECIWRIEVPTGFTVVFSFDSLEIGEESECFRDYLEIYDGPSTSSPVMPTTIFAADKDIKECQLVIFFLLHRKLYVREDAVETFF